MRNGVEAIHCYTIPKVEKGEHRVFRIDVGNKPNDEVLEYLEKIQVQLRDQFHPDTSIFTPMRPFKDRFDQHLADFAKGYGPRVLSRFKKFIQDTNLMKYWQAVCNQCGAAHTRIHDDNNPYPDGSWCGVCEDKGYGHCEHLYWNLAKGAIDVTDMTDAEFIRVLTDVGPIITIEVEND